MGLIKAIAGAAGGVLADQWKEYFYCESLSNDVLCCRGSKRVSARSSNTKGEPNIITNGSIIAVPEGTCMIVVTQGKIKEVCAEAGEYKFDDSREPSVFTGGFGNGLLDSLKNIGNRFTFGGQPANDQRIYYVNTKEITGNKYGTPNSVPFRVVDQRAAIDIDVSVRCFGEYSYRISDPIKFFVNLCGNVSGEFTRDMIDNQLKSELLTSLQPAFARISEMGIRYSALPGKTKELSDALRIELTELWHEKRGIEIEKVGVSSIKADEEDEKMLKEMQRNTAFMDPLRGAAHLVGSQGDAMKMAATNSNGAVSGFYGMGMAGNAGGMNAQSLYAMGQSQQIPTSQPAQNNASWTCSCGTKNTGKFCLECGKPNPDERWTCTCGTKNTGKFCSECGSPKPNEEWTCSCGTKNKGKFCAECGAKRP